MPALEYQIVPARWHHAGALARRLCSDRWLAYKASGVDPKAQLRGLVQTSLIARTCILDGRVVAMWGMTGSLLSKAGALWMAISRDAADHPVALLKEVRNQLSYLFHVKQELRITVAEQDTKAIRFAEFLGFEQDGNRSQVGKSNVFLVPMVLRR